MMDAVSPSTDKKIAGLDGIRGIAVILVLLFHGFSGYMRPFFSPELYTWTGLGALVLKFTEPLSGGVEIFFVLSGFLITRSLLSVEEPTWQKIGDFYRRRLARLGPLYLILLIALLVIFRSPTFFALSALFVMNFSSLLHVRTDWLPIWSISVEFQFYFLWPLLLRSVGQKGLTITCIAIAVLSPLARYFGSQYGLDTYSLSPFRFDGLAIGSLMALFLFSITDTVMPRLRLISWSCFVFFVLAIVVYPNLLDRSQSIGEVFSFNVWQLLGIALIGFAFVVPRSFRWLNCGLLRRTGEWSYGLFLIHPFLFFVINELVKAHDPQMALGGHLWFVFLRATIVFSASFFFAWMSYEYFERPAYRFFARQRLRTSNS